MARNTSISLGEHFDAFIATQIESGRYASVSEVVRAGLRLLQRSDEREQLLRQMLIEGEQSGIAQYSYDELMQELDAQ